LLLSQRSRTGPKRLNRPTKLIPTHFTPAPAAAVAAAAAAAAAAEFAAATAASKRGPVTVADFREPMNRSTHQAGATHTFMLPSHWLCSHPLSFTLLSLYV
jgi:hypothetical protein